MNSDFNSSIFISKVNNNENTCSHCGTYVDIGYSDFVMSSKKKIS